MLLWPGIAWSEPLSFEHLTVDEGLPDNTIRAILQDREGYLWIGSHAGLIRYDGYEMRAFVPDPADSNSIGCRLINSLFLDSRGDLWIGSLANGVARYSPQTERFKNFAPRQLASDGTLPGSVVVQMAETRDGSILVHFDDTSSLAQIDPVSLKVKVIPPPPDSNAALQGLHVDEQGLLWQGLEGQGVIVRAPNGVMVQEIGIRKGLEIPNIFQIASAGAGRMWFLGLNTLSLYDQRTRQLDTFAPSDWGHSTRLRFMAMEGDGEGGLWIGADAGLYHFSLADETFTLIKHEPGRHDALANGPVVSLCRDRSGILWIGTWHAGLDKLDPQARKFSTFEAGESGDKATLPIASVSSILVDGRKNLWVGTGSLAHSGPIGGLARLDASTNTFRSLVFPENSVRTVMNIAATHPDSLWLGTNAGLWLCLTREDIIVRPQVLGPGLESLLSDPIRSLMVDSQGDLWIGTPNNGLYRFHPATGVGRQFSHDPNDPRSLSSNSVTCVEEEKGGRFWVGTDLNGLNLLDPDTGHCQRFYDPRNGLVNVSDFVVSPEGPLWVGSVSGLLKFEPQSGTTHALGSRYGLTDGLVASVVSDEEGTLWLSTESGLVKYDPATQEIQRYDTRDGLPSNEACFAHFRTATGTIYLGGPGGVVYFHPAQVKIPSSYQPPIVLTDVQVVDRLQQPVPPRAPFSAWPKGETIELPWNQSDLVFRFASLDFSRPERIRYRFKLENHDQSWRKPGLERRAEYSRLSPGTYRFRVQASSGDGSWGPDEASLDLVINSPWWATTWAWLAYAALFVAMIILGYRLALRREKRRTKLGIRLAEARKIRELDQVKSRFFANISHEFRTPLTLIQGPLSRLEQDPGSGDAALFAMMRRNAQRLGQLINQLLDLSRLENKQFPLKWQPLDVVGMLKVLGASFDSLARSRGLEFRTILPDHAVPGLADADLLEKVVGNLLSNAIRYAPMGERVWLEVSVGDQQELKPGQLGEYPPQAKEFRLIHISVGNTGSYIRDEDKARIFDRFYQSPRHANGQRLGSGIGLALIRELVDLLGGDISVDSQPGEGTIFSVSLPLFATATPHPHDHAGTVARAPGDFGMRVPEDSTLDPKEELAGGTAPLLLVAEDDPDLRAYIFEVLKPHYRVILAQDGEEGLEAAFTEVPDLVISDVMMPLRDGFQLCSAIKKDNRTNHIPVILLTARAGKASRLKGLETGADIYLPKPFEPEILLAQVRNLIEQRQLLQARYARAVIWGGNRADQPQEPSKEDTFLEEARNIVVKNLDESEFNVVRFSREVGMSRSQLHRKLTALTGMSASAFIRIVRLQKAGEMLSSGYGNVTEVAMATGHQSLSHFSRTFREHFGVNPSQYPPEKPQDRKLKGKG